MITTVVFDADETLIDLRPAVRGALTAVPDQLRRLTPAAAALTLARHAGCLAESQRPAAPHGVKPDAVVGALAELPATVRHICART